ncbi:MAG: hypothetical protein E7031_05345 [Akkermansiaceae bacterium]|nr:hypothetical protein [Akkermansiaceae bacterium]
MSSETETSYRFANRISIRILFWMIGFALVATTGGVTYAMLKIEEHAVRQEIEKVNREIAACNMRINQHRAKINTMTGRWNMLTRLESIGSDMRPIESSQLQELRTMRHSETGTATASR